MDVRTTVHRRLLSFDDLAEMRRELDELGVREWSLQQFHPAETLDPSLEDEATYSDMELLEIAKRLGGGTKVRGVKIPEWRYEKHASGQRDAAAEMAAR
jgi:MoaA/NifB/PqqE/SkfB family radical SAM enzyme